MVVETAYPTIFFGGGAMKRKVTRHIVDFFAPPFEEILATAMLEVPLGYLILRVALVLLQAILG